MGRPSKFDSSTKVRVVLEALKESCTLQELGKKYGVAPNQILAWKELFLSRINIVFELDNRNDAGTKVLARECNELQKQVNQLTIERDIFCKCLRESRDEKALRLIESQRPAGLSRTRCCAMLHLNRSSLYYKPKPERQENIEVKRMIKEYHDEHPTAGVMTMRNVLLQSGLTVNVKRIRRLMHEMGIQGTLQRKKAEMEEN